MPTAIFAIKCKTPKSVLPPYHTVAVTKTVSKIPKITRPSLKMSSLKDAKAVIEEGGCTIWGQLPDIPYKSDKFGLGFTSGAQKVVRRACAEDHP